MTEMRTAKEVAEAIQAMPFGEVMALVSALQDAKSGRKQFDGAVLMRACDIVLGKAAPDGPASKSGKVAKKPD